TLHLDVLEECAGDRHLTGLEDVDQELAGVGDHLRGSVVGLGAEDNQWRSEGCLGEPVHRGASHVVAVLYGHHEEAVWDHAEGGLLCSFVHRKSPLTAWLVW